ncbi:MAG: PDZ domain-containing protein [Gemmataceae bacterium]
MRGLDLRIFDFDYDRSWMALFIAPEGRVLGRFGGTDLEGAKRLSAFHLALKNALARHASRRKDGLPAGALPAEDYASARKAPPRSCIHCHHVHEFQRADALPKGAWTPAGEYRYPEPAALGLTLDPEDASRIQETAPDSPAGRASVRAGDFILSAHGVPIASRADLSFALDRAPAAGKLGLVILRSGVEKRIDLDLPARWKEQTDISWRWSLKALAPDPPVAGDALDDIERKALGIPADRLALRQGPFLSDAARHAGVRIGDIIVGVDGMRPRLTGRQFEAWFRLSHRPGQETTLLVLRGKEELTIRLRLP